MIAASFESPTCMRCTIVTIRCTQLATTIISTMVGAGAVGAESGRPAQPPSPIAADIDEQMTNPVAMTPENRRMSTAKTSAMIAMLTGRNIIWLLTDASVKTWPIITVPTTRTSIPEKPLLHLGGEVKSELGDLGDPDRLMLRFHLHGDIDGAHAPVPGYQAAGEPRVGQRDLTDPGSFVRIAEHIRIHEVADPQVVAVRRRVLEVGDRIHARGVRRLPRLLGQPDRSRERPFRRGVAIVGHDHEEDVVALAVRILQRFERDELGIVLAEENSVVRGELQEQAAGGSEHDEDRRRHDDAPAVRNHPFGKPCFEGPRRAVRTIRHPGNRHAEAPQATRSDRCGSARCTDAGSDNLPVAHEKTTLTRGGAVRTPYQGSLYVVKLLRARACGHPRRCNLIQSPQQQRPAEIASSCSSFSCVSGGSARWTVSRSLS